MNQQSVASSDEGAATGNGARAKVLIRVTIFAVILVVLWGFVSGHWERPMPWVFLGTWAMI